MSKRALTKYLADLGKEELAAQLLDLYDRFPIVKEYYDFAFDPKEDKLLQGAKTKISLEYFPVSRKRAKARRSVAQKAIKHFIGLGVDPHLTADLMLYNLEVAQTYSVEKNLPVGFYKSMANSFGELTRFIALHGILEEYKQRIANCYRFTQEHQWPHSEAFSKSLDILE